MSYEPTTLLTLIAQSSRLIAFLFMSIRNTPSTERTSSYDYILIALFLSLIAIGWLMIYSVGYKQGYNTDFSDFLFKTPVGKQTISILVASVIALLVFSVDSQFWRIFSYAVYGIGILLLILVLIFGKSINGAKAWFIIAGSSFQPVEIAKIGTLLALSSFISAPENSLQETRSIFSILGILLLPMALVALQPDAGSMLVFFSFGILLFREGLSPTPYILGLSAAFLFVIGLVVPPMQLSLWSLFITAVASVLSFKYFRNYFLSFLIISIPLCAYFFNKGWEKSALSGAILCNIILLVILSQRGKLRSVILILGTLLIAIPIFFATNFAFEHVFSSHQKTLIDAWLRPERTKSSQTYNIMQSKLAIGSGGFQGKGFLEGNMTRLNYVPEQHSDFIFCTVGEEQGFIGVFGVVVIYLLFLVRIIQTAENQRSVFVRTYGYGLAGILFFHFFINIGMTMGILPVIGIPLPFLSSGGSSLIGFSTTFAIYLKMTGQR